MIHVEYSYTGINLSKKPGYLGISSVSKGQPSFVSQSTLSKNAQSLWLNILPKLSYIAFFDPPKKTCNSDPCNKTSQKTMRPGHSHHLAKPNSAPWHPNHITHPCYSGFHWVELHLCMMFPLFGGKKIINPINPMILYIDRAGDGWGIAELINSLS